MSEATSEDDEDVGGCGWEYDHDLRLLHTTDDGEESYECRNCGAEIFSEPDA